MKTSSPKTVVIVRTDEELMIARSVCRAFGLGMATEKRNSDHATKYISRLNSFSADVSPIKTVGLYPSCGRFVALPIVTA